MTPRRDARTERLWELGDFGHGQGLEIGPLHSPIVARGDADVQYADVLSTEELRAYYAEDGGVDKDLIPEVDFALTENGVQRSLAEVTRDAPPFDWVMASHVIEHVADLVGWLQDVAETVRDDGALVLAVPDGRFTFDVLRPVTTVGQALEAHERGDLRPGVRAVYDHFSSVVDVDVAALWDGAEPPGLDTRSVDLPGIRGQVDRSRAGYVDVHVWVFTPDSFRWTIEELRRLGLCPWYVDEIQPTEYYSHEFMARLRRLPRGADPRETVAGEVRPDPRAPDWLRGSGGPRNETEKLRAQVAKVRRRARRQSAELQAIRGSRRWKLAGALGKVGTPVRSLVRRVRR